jgi:hypothetical protein
MKCSSLFSIGIGNTIQISKNRLGIDAARIVRRTIAEDNNNWREAPKLYKHNNYMTLDWTNDHR